MNLYRGIWMVGGLSLAGLAVISWSQWREVGEREAQASATAQRRQQAEIALRGIEQAVAAAEARAVDLRAAVAKARPKAPAAAPAPVVRRPALPSFAERLRTEPETQALWVTSRRHELATQYGPFLRSLKLSPEDQARFEAIALRRDEKEMDLQAAATTQGLPSGDPVLQTLRREMQGEYEAAVRDLLGDEGYREMREYERMSAMREMVNGVVGGSVLVAREPITPNQAEQLIRIMANASERFRSGGPATGADLNWDEIDAQARTILTPAQFAYFSQMEPPLPMGARFQAQLYQRVDEANRHDVLQRRNGAVAPGK